MDLFCSAIFNYRHVSSKVVREQVPFMMGADSVATVQVWRKKNTGFVRNMPGAKIQKRAQHMVVITCASCQKQYNQSNGHRMKSDDW